MERIFFLISCFSSVNTGNGGHYHSVKTIAQAYKKYKPQSDVRIVSVGDFAPPALMNSSVPYKHVHIGIRQIFSLTRVLDEFSDEPPTHVHAFDRKAYLFAACIASECGARLYLTKPGGPNPKFYFPFCEDLFLFSHENMKWFRGKKKFARARMHFLPNRAVRVVSDEVRIEALRHRANLSGFIVLRIARIGPYYWRTAQQTLRLAAAFRSEGIPAKAVFIGTVESEETLQSLENLKHDADIIITDPEFTKNAAELLPLGDVVVGTGRSLMEAAMAGKPVFCPTAELDMPVLLGKENVSQLMEANFSERSSLSATEYERVRDMTKSLGALFGNPQNIADIQREVLAIAAEFFDVETAVKRYEEIYAVKQSFTLSFVDFSKLWAGFALAALRGK